VPGELSLNIGELFLEDAPSFRKDIGLKSGYFRLQNGTTDLGNDDVEYT
jgi:hypothetical protein